MRKFLTLCLVLVVGLLSIAAPAAAVAPVDLNALAAHYPATTAMFFSIRTDDAYIDTLDGLLARINTAFPQANAPSLRVALDEAIENIGAFEGGDFDSVIRSWLGDTASLGLPKLVPDTDENEQPVLIALAVTDRAAAEAFFDTAATQGAVERSTDGDYTLYTDTNDDVYLAIGDDVLFLANLPETLPLTAPAETLASAETFTSSLGLLPESDYNITGYINTQGLMAVLQAEASDMIPGSLAGLFENLPPVVFGATILDERSFTIDTVTSTAAVLEQMQALGMAVTMSGPVDPAFVERIPAGTPLVVHGRDLSLIYEQVVASLQTQIELQSEMSGQDLAELQEQIETGLAQVRLGIQGVTGLNLEEELLPALTGDYALYLGLNTEAAEGGMASLMAQLPVEFGLLISMSDATISERLASGISNTFQALNGPENVSVEVNSETFGGTDVSVITITDANNLPFPLELIVGGSDELFFIGTRAAARAAFNPDGGLLSDAQYQEAAGYYLDGSSAVAYLGSAGLLPLVDIISMTGSASDAENFAGLLQLISSASITTSVVGDVSYSRAVWTLPE